MNETTTREMVSALADGQLQGAAFADALRRANEDPGVTQAWAEYHLIGDVLRSAELARTGAAPGDFMAKLQQRLREEQVHGGATALEIAPEPEVVQPAGSVTAANAGRWKVAAGVASAAAVAALSWSVAGSRPTGAQLATAPAGIPVASTAERGRMMRDARLDQLLAAHRQLGGAGALQAPNGFLRNATYEAPSR